MTPDPIDTSAGILYEHLAWLRAECPVSRTASGAYYLARYEDVLAGHQVVDTFQASSANPVWWCRPRSR
ncbi:MAG: hypothetical protein WD598_00850 [Acidimicrobiia bacterium]